MANIRSHARLVFLVIVVATTLVPRPSPAIGDSCSGNFTGGANCSFVFAGPTLVITGTAIAVSAPWVERTILEPNSGLSFGDCYASAVGTRTHCQSISGPGAIVPVASTLPAGVVLTCQVAGRSSGTFSCGSFA